MQHIMNTEVQEMGRLILESIRDEVLSDRVFKDGYSQRILGYHHRASQWVDLDHEDSPMREDTMWYLDPEGELELETEYGRLYLSNLDDEATSKLR